MRVKQPDNTAGDLYQQSRVTRPDTGSKLSEKMLIVLTGIRDYLLLEMQVIS